MWAPPSCAALSSMATCPASTDLQHERGGKGKAWAARMGVLAEHQRWCAAACCPPRTVVRRACRRQPPTSPWCRQAARSRARRRLRGTRPHAAGWRRRCCTWRARQQRKGCTAGSATPGLWHTHTNRGPPQRPRRRLTHLTMLKPRAAGCLLKSRAQMASHAAVSWPTACANQQRLVPQPSHVGGAAGPLVSSAIRALTARKSPPPPGRQCMAGEFDAGVDVGRLDAVYVSHPTVGQPQRPSRPHSDSHTRDVPRPGTRTAQCMASARAASASLVSVSTTVFYTLRTPHPHHNTHCTPAARRQITFTTPCLRTAMPPRCPSRSSRGFWAPARPRW